MRGRPRFAIVLCLLVAILASSCEAIGDNQPLFNSPAPPIPAPPIADAVTFRPEQVILPDAEFPLSGYRVDTDERFGTDGWTRVWRGSDAFAWVRVSVTVLEPSAGSRSRIAATKCDDWTFTPPALSAAEITAPVVGDGAKACGYDFEDRPVGALQYRTGTRNVVVTVGVSRRCASQAAAAEFVASLADYQLWIIDRVAPPSGVALRPTPKVQVPTACAAVTPRPPAARPASARPTASGITGGALTPARQLEGTWTTTSPVTFYSQVGGCSGTRETVDQHQSNVTWKITAVPGFENVLDVEVTDTPTTPVFGYVRVCGGPSGIPGVPPIPDVTAKSADPRTTPLTSPLMRATVSGAAITLNEPRYDINASGSFAGDVMTLTWNWWHCNPGCGGEFTLPNALILRRQP